MLFFIGYSESWSAAKSVAMSQQVCTRSPVKTTAKKPEVVDSTKVTSPRGLSRSGSTTSTSSSTGRQPPAPPARHPSTVITSSADRGGVSGCNATRRSHGSQRAWGNAYELSQDIRERQLEALARR